MNRVTGAHDDPIPAPHSHGLTSAAHRTAVFFWLALVLFCGMGFAGPALADEEDEDFTDDTYWGINAGLGGTIITSEYKDVEHGGSLLPLLGYEGKHFYWRGLAAGVHIFRNEMHELNAQISYLPQHFYSSLSDSPGMEALDDRYSSMLAGLNYHLSSDYGIIQATLAVDTLGYSNGVVADISYSYPLRLYFMSLTPTLGLQWTDGNYNTYYYGVSHSESQRGGLSVYEPSASVSPYAGLTARMLLSADWSLFASGQVMLLPEEIRNSPMVDKDSKYSLSLGVLYNF